MNWEELLMNHFLWGLAIGLLLWLITILKHSAVKRRLIKQNNIKTVGLKNEMTKLKEHLQTQLEIEAEKKEMERDKIEDLKTKNENLRTTIQTLKQKPKREEIILLQVYDRAVHIMLERAPGFGPTWENTLKDAKEEIDKANKGIVPFIKRVIHPSAHPVLTSKNIKQAKQLMSNDSEWSNS
ncbi:MAG: hypothetical protein K9L78_02190 [Victivallales bacterium]|nr:hypothetical protein [Victivallales bacterium]MCF7888904.1 hypothetical protein [Victivallales bacterium]